MKKTLSLLLAVALLLVPFPAGASDNNFSTDGYYKVYGRVIGTCEMNRDMSDGFDENTAYYHLTVDLNSTIEFESSLDTLYIAEEEKGGETFFEFYDGVRVSSPVCSVNYTPMYRYDSMDLGLLDVDPENEVEYMAENATVRFNKAGIYILDAMVGAKDGDERISQFNENREGYMVRPTIYLAITVKDEAASENIYDLLPYDENIFSVSGITGYDSSRVVLNDYTVVMCSSPVTITAQQDLEHMSIAKIENINGEWVETRYFDNYAINYGDINKNWYPAEGFEDTYDDCFEFVGVGDFDAGVKKGTSVSLAQPGMYSVWGNTYNGEATGFTFEVGDIYATYTNSKVLLDGKDIKFEAYNINGNNYFKLRDIAYALTAYGHGTIFNVKWDGGRNLISLITETKYDAVGGELKEGDGTNKPYQGSTSALMKDGANVTLNAYLINGNNYFKLRDLGKLFDFNVSWDGANNCILIDSTSSYRE